jgi:hypothetical protein
MGYIHGPLRTKATVDRLWMFQGSEVFHGNSPTLSRITVDKTDSINPTDNEVVVFYIDTPHRSVVAMVVIRAFDQLVPMLVNVFGIDALMNVAVHQSLQKSREAYSGKNPNCGYQKSVEEIFKFSAPIMAYLNHQYQAAPLSMRR